MYTDWNKCYQWTRQILQNFIIGIKLLLPHLYLVETIYDMVLPLLLCNKLSLKGHPTL